MSGNPLQFSYEINIGHLLTIIVIAISGLAAWNSLDKRVVEATARVTALEQINQRQDESIRQASEAVQDRLRSIDDKIDRLRELQLQAQHAQPKRDEFVLPES